MVPYIASIQEEGKEVCFLRQTLVLAALVALCAMVAVPASASGFDDNFDAYIPGMPLSGQGGWVGGETTVTVVTPGYGGVGNCVRITQDGTSLGSQCSHGINVAPDANGQIWWTWLVKPGQAGGGGGNCWDTWLNDADGKNFARWYGAWNTARPRIDGFGQVLAGYTLKQGVWNVLTVRVDTNTHISEFFANGADLGGLNYSTNQPGMGNVAALISMGQQGNSQGNGGSADYLDNLHIGDIPEPSSLAAFGMLGLAALGFVRRRRA